MQLHISTNPKAIYSKLYWIHFKVLLVQQKSMALGTMQSHTYRTALLGSQNCWWIGQVNYQEPEHAVYLELISKTYKVYIRLLFTEFLNLKKNTVLGIIWHQISMYLMLWFNLFYTAKPSLDFHFLAPLSHFFSNKYYVIDSRVLFYTPYSAMSCCSGNTSVQMLNSSNKNFMQNTIMSEETWVLTWKRIIYLLVVWQIHFFSLVK